MSIFPGRVICFHPRVLRKNSLDLMTSLVASVKWCRRVRGGVSTAVIVTGDAVSARVLAGKREGSDTKGMRRAVPVLALVVLLCPTGGRADEEPTARIRSPKPDAQVDYHFTAKGRSSNIPEGQVVMLFRPIGESGFLFPLSEELKGNRSFSEKIYHEMKDEGSQVIQVRMLPVELAAKAAYYRREILKWYNGGKKGPQPSLAPGLLENTRRLAEVVYELERK